MTIKHGTVHLAPSHVLAILRRRGHKIALVPARFLVREALAALGDLKGEAGLMGSIAVAGLLLVAVLLKERRNTRRQSEQPMLDDS